MYMSFRLEEKKELASLYENSFLEAMEQNKILSGIVSNLENQNASQRSLLHIGEMELQQAWSNCKDIQKQLDKQKRKNTFNIIVGSVIIGGLTTFIIAR